MDNTSGQGKDAVVPEEIKGLSWGGFFWNWLWGLFNRVWLSLLVFIPVVGMVVPFVLLFKGREWAWRNKTWESVEQFNRVQRKWAIAALIFLGIGFAIMAGAIFMGGMLDESPGSSTTAQSSPPAPNPAAATSPRPQVTPSQPSPAAPAPAAAESAPRPALLVATEEGKAPKAAVISVALPVGSPTPAAAGVRAPALMMANAPAQAEPAPAARAPRPRTERPSQPPDPVAEVESKVYTPKYNDLMTAVLRPDRQGVSELLDLGRWIDKPDASGVTPLLAAVRNRDTAMAELLISRGANVNATASSVVGALAIARRNADPAMTTLLVRSGAR